MGFLVITFQRCILVLAFLFSVPSRVFAGNVFGAGVLLGDDGEFFDVAIPGDPHAPVVKVWSPSSPRLSGSSTDSDFDCDTFFDASSRRHAYDFVGAVDQIHQLRYGKYGAEMALSGELTVEDYKRQWILARKNILECRALLTTFREQLVLQRKKMHPEVDARMRRSFKVEEPVLLRPFEQGYASLCVIYQEYLRIGFNLGMGVAVPHVKSILEDSDLDLPSHLKYKICGECKATWRSETFDCSNCEALVADIPEDRADFFEASCNLVWVFRHSEAFKDAIKTSLEELSDLSEAV